MAARTIAFALGALLVHQLAALPDPLYAGLAPLLLPVLAAGGRLAAPAAFLLGAAFTAAHAHHALSARLPAALQGVDLQVDGRVTGVPVPGSRRLRFVLRLDTPTRLPDGAPGWRALGCRLRLSWYEPPPGVRVAAGERWRMTVRLRQPRMLRNRGGFDGEHRALREGVCATGYLRGAPVRLAPAAPDVDVAREALARRIDARLADLPARGVVKALAVGVRDDVAPEHARLMRVTGTAHLMAISGLHVGLVAGMGLLAGRLLARGVPGALRRMPAAHWGALAGLAAAVAYAALAGFSVPTQRALVMLAVLVAAALARRRCARHEALCLALAAVLLLDPLAVHDLGTWLSFAAVAGLLWALPPRAPAPGPWLRRAAAGALRVQAVACLALLPLAVLCFAYQSLSAPLANLLAVPVTGLLAVPAILAGLGLGTLAPQVGDPLLRLGGHVMGVLLEALARLPGHDRVLVPAAAPTWPALLLAAAGVAVLLLPLPWRVRLAGALLLAPLLLPPSAGPGPGELSVRVLDVGQGLAVVLRTARHALVYDTGPAWESGFDAGSRVVAPALRRDGLDRLDLLVVSHHHADHAGGAPGLLATTVVGRVIGPAGAAGDAVPCTRGLSWSWDGYTFRVLHPRAPDAAGNDASCVLHVAGPGGRVLLPADVEARAERQLVADDGAALAADVLLVPHHGSRTSSTREFLRAVRPVVAVNSSGHRNRFRLPAQEVVARYRALGSRLEDTACGGQIGIHLAPGRAPRVERWRDRELRFWHARDRGDHCAP